MLISYKDLTQFAVEARDGRKGHAKDLYFDDESWRVRYAVAESGFLFTHREGLVKSSLLGQPDVQRRRFPVDLTKEQIDDAASPDAHPPVGVQRDRDIRRSRLRFWPPLMIGAPGAAYTPGIAEHQLVTGTPLAERDVEEEVEEGLRALDDPHLRSLREVSGYAIEAKDGSIGTVADVLLDPDGWKIRYIVVDTGTWLPGRQVAIRPDWVTHVSWDGQSMVVSMTIEELSDAPEVSQLDELERSDTHLAMAPYGAYAGIGP